MLSVVRNWDGSLMGGVCYCEKHYPNRTRSLAGLEDDIDFPPQNNVISHICMIKKSEQSISKIAPLLVSWVS